MPDPKTADARAALGFLTVVEYAESGLFGGYLLLNMVGRPLEFHCTAPLKPNRAQRILYGPTLEPYLFGEQIGRTLLEKTKTQPLVVCTDQEPALAVRQYARVPVVLVLCEDSAAVSVAATDPPEAAVEVGRRWRLDGPHPADRRLTELQLGSNHLAVSADDRQLVSDRLGALSETFDLSEPFLRIREAIEEARRGGS